MLDMHRIDLFPLEGAIATLLGLVCIFLGWRAASLTWSLRHIPGPFWARFTNLQRVYWVQTANSHNIHTELHRRYGDFVRMGPNMVSISDPRLISAVYPIRAGLPKASYYLDLIGSMYNDAMSHKSTTIYLNR